LGFHHIGIACKDIEKEIKKIKKIHDVKSVSEIVYDEKQKARLCMLSVENGLNIELVSGEQISTMLNRNITYYHICYKVNNISSKIDELVSNGAFLISSPKPAVLFNGKKVAFLQSTYGLIELIKS
jgi:methylmalonyl-CoA/ethylmalonyl-CoA epimerase